ncbi:hypothetical protein [Cognatilysobacter bugurensis]|uniref:Uncharacterized protein n=1 Tax=Cognatilysobacter bugurensis TaxID=543356 RepID=A0A918SSR0_9GAMM|nr:hypothetical protein [Lysobacter bugurensis]GHA68609.1 hypothetical protein GCM10007067_00570 [Lysobacter bugurensis]
MYLLLLVVAAIAIAALGSASFAVAFGLLIIAIPLTVRGSAQADAGMEVSLVTPPALSRTRPLLRSS